ncbi:Phosphatidylglycerol/phosphatidylinositol transfer protein [Elasticomyces elasticus]|uniref:Phosphatidylglycerol/phosphatidylinositol transfer protein n=1 Tax=Exophiala sideris TaxID=1016849 RepID=A0A0D1X9L3_9EURO|nr:Phosphatidylglycerol/phosphatidylinositol transfer protein [Elasticomyces elasticus]KAK5028706.1 Phosphatidylglycerol/phosphatidylinositol transfer protein [Exophiala sideris]KAK5035574.1 Phosphatidylglycerol/phosphatidylinositol transfer protein [Exophiala sideris]KAK5057210.1 Phosphatidylglycerol/phosphatidylinositol transfer protein [Exophiala sideris]KIV84496.1 hypothetical protein PV11_00271 [Exophiala sideris]
MKTSAVLLSLLTAVSASLLGGQSQKALVDDAFSVPGKNPLNFCADPKEYILTVDFVDLSPNPPQPGQKLTITANGTFSKDIEPGATVFLQVKYGLITLIKQEADLCDNLPKIDMSCPIKEGVLSLTKEVDIPKQVPPGKYTVLADVSTVDKEKITCMESTVFFSRPG